MNNPADTRIAILGAGPIGLEAALYARTLGYRVTVYESGTIGNHLLAWGHVQLFTPWSLNMSALGERRLRETGGFEIDPDHLPKGAELVWDYLLPLSRLPELESCIREKHRVATVGRGGMLKGEGIGDGSRAGEPFRLLIDGPDGEVMDEADIVIDATGVFGQPNALGRGGIPAPGERQLADHIEFGLPDVEDIDRSDFEGLRVLVVGGGHSGATVVIALARLPETEVFWVTRSGTPPVAEVAEDPLPARQRLAAEANRLAVDSPAGFHHLPESTITGLAELDEGVGVRILAPDGEREIEVDRIVAQTGFHPDNSLYRELQVHECYASGGPMKLAASLLGSDSGDCMTQTGFGPDSLTNPEPSFFIIGNKSYGRNGNFLLRIGREQVRDVFRLVTGDPALDLYAAEKSHV